MWRTYTSSDESIKQKAEVRVSDQAGPFAFCEGKGCGGLTRVISNPLLPETVGEDRLG